MHPLTDAFIKGRAKFKKTTGKYFDKEKNPKAACAIGAMYWGTFGKLSDTCAIELSIDYPEIRNTVPIPCDDLSEKEGWITKILVHLNDDHDGRSGWTDEKIAAWLDNALTAKAS